MEIGREPICIDNTNWEASDMKASFQCSRCQQPFNTDVDPSDIACYCSIACPGCGSTSVIHVMSDEDILDSLKSISFG
jgi:Zn finger protein HypA/HybF involved in hydrogenase expression